MSRSAMKHPAFVTSVLISLGYYILTFLSTLRVLVSIHKQAREKNREGYPPLYTLSSRLLGNPYLWRPRPGNSGEGTRSQCAELLSYRYTGAKRRCVNLASYNYLGFADNRGRSAEFSIGGIHKYGLSMGATSRLYGTTDLHVELERLTAEFVGAEDSLACGMGFIVNSLHLPTLMGKGSLVLSDEMNHASIVVGVKVSGATVKVFRHNDVAHLERLLKEAVHFGQRKSSIHEQWKKIFIIVEGVYSMEGTVAPLPEIIALKKKYKAYLYLDEAHSIGAVGKNGRGVVEYFNCNPKDIDILMGTYTKSFGASGGYIAGEKRKKYKYHVFIDIIPFKE